MAWQRGCGKKEYGINSPHAQLRKGIIIQEMNRNSLQLSWILKYLIKILFLGAILEFKYLYPYNALEFKLTS